MGFFPSIGEITQLSPGAQCTTAAHRSGLLPPDMGCSGLLALMMGVPEGQLNEGAQRLTLCECRVSAGASGQMPSSAKDKPALRGF